MQILENRGWDVLGWSAVDRWLYYKVSTMLDALPNADICTVQTTRHPITCLSTFTVYDSRTPPLGPLMHASTIVHLPHIDHLLSPGPRNLVR